ncbi:uncharacterized protein LAESUDRAFT_732877 [Laetiporus sulphureus 93-53]|uniref:Uncharacterized protein n=1 Tax=Laetiporus sulphureus 93-53 TaxID=1314785 RepID=A0A165AWA6_9APHY|nr:uncharacterized protein LAESUDRAFT_732877 [Laetiporus sulphureus 93-53]KZS99780.1 hypothetical protein LAESUDRAFT_732877 [Laetiporus sulphureus 93-53]
MIFCRRSVAFSTTRNKHLSSLQRSQKRTILMHVGRAIPQPALPMTIVARLQVRGYSTTSVPDAAVSRTMLHTTSARHHSECRTLLFHTTLRYPKPAEGEGIVSSAHGRLHYTRDDHLYHADTENGMKRNSIYCARAIYMSDAAKSSPECPAKRTNCNRSAPEQI